MKRKVMMMLTSALAIGVLSACGSAKESAHSDSGQGGSNHASHTAAPSASQGAHGAHAGHAANEPSADSYKADFSFATEAVTANDKSDLTIRITDDNGKAVQDFQVSHEKLMHLIAVSKDLSYFSHIHPEYQGDGTFTIGTTFPSGGEYKLFADFVPKGGSSTTLSEWVKVAGEAKAPEAVLADTELTKVIDGKEIKLALSGTKAKEEVMLTFNIADAKTKEGISDLEQYLGAVGHVVILSEDAEQYLHVHPMDEKAKGPKAEFMTTFPKSGTYKIWGQFQRQGTIFTVPFVVRID